jgi:iron complex transport system substrate-binding protein
VHVKRDQVFDWNPDAVVTNSPEFWQDRTSPEWSALPAIGKGRLYRAPALPWGWIDEPPSANRLLGPVWAAHALYATGTAETLRTEAVRFYRQFYRTELSSQQFEELMR